MASSHNKISGLKIRYTSRKKEMVRLKKRKKVVEVILEEVVEEGVQENWRYWCFKGNAKVLK